ncbi:GNAT superfamily N-acetyltransferase [Marmoricola sp. OAE513]|uniref:GNAT family N-acetyltransferase n=1 Tax=Marmoricola sp. OAE513 TaxID=2817894 RepID=UPI001AE3B845
MYTLEFLDDPHVFLAAAEPLLSAEPVRCTVIASVTARHLRGGASRPAGAPEPWWLVVRDAGGTVVGAGMRTAPLPPYPPYFVAMPDDAARLVARTLHERGEAVEIVNGFVPTIDVLVAETLVLAGGTATETERTSLYELTDLVEPTGVPGHLRVARDDEVDLVQGWFDAFGPDASEQAGRVDPHPAIETRESTAARIAAGDVWLWETPDGVPAGVTAFNPASFGVARVGPVFTPKEHRGHGYAAAGVAAISRRLLDEGARVCLFADAQNTTSTGVYVRLGFRPIAETGGLRLDRLDNRGR